MLETKCTSNRSHCPRASTFGCIRFWPVSARHQFDAEYFLTSEKCWPYHSTTCLFMFSLKFVFCLLIDVPFDPCRYIHITLQEFMESNGLINHNFKRSFYYRYFGCTKIIWQTPYISSLTTHAEKIRTSLSSLFLPISWKQKCLKRYEMFR